MLTAAKCHGPEVKRYRCYPQGLNLVGPISIHHTPALFVPAGCYKWLREAGHGTCA
jgi:hypothetical protein